MAMSSITVVSNSLFLYRRKFSSKINLEYND
jgi:hypothetical protein